MNDDTSADETATEQEAPEDTHAPMSAGQFLDTLASLPARLEAQMVINDLVAASLYNIVNLLPPFDTTNIANQQRVQELNNNLNMLVQFLINNGSQSFRMKTEEDHPSSGQRDSGLIIP